MRQGVTLLHIGGTFQVEEQPPQHHPLHQITPPSPLKKSPVPYLFGGLAAMLGLIAFALLMLACSYWKLSGYYQDNAAVEDTSSEATTSDDEKLKVVKEDATYMNSMLVIMAGDEKPTFLATPATSRVSSFGDSEGSKGSSSSSSGGCCCGGGGGDDEATVVIEGDEKG